eukprot:CAMPEP_0184222614 /NCGR_PEP_ID=MMETSP0976-20121227/18823_1 /TAXON_ID=483370 /ORGANISM="non described non described, Strain CCMP2097" /LENGTH=206 /DNA_ID=CAMNT_0026527529 /DNA_START=55 /DNA_END=675 /DNA_ORIENTATION=-
MHGQGLAKGGPWHSVQTSTRGCAASASSVEPAVPDAPSPDDSMRPGAVLRRWRRARPSAAATEPDRSLFRCASGLPPGVRVASRAAPAISAAASRARSASDWCAEPSDLDLRADGAAAGAVAGKIRRCVWLSRSSRRRAAASGLVSNPSARNATVCLKPSTVVGDNGAIRRSKKFESIYLVFISRTPRAINSGLLFSPATQCHVQL